MGKLHKKGAVVTGAVDLGSGERQPRIGRWSAPVEPQQVRAMQL